MYYLNTIKISAPPVPVRNQGETISTEDAMKTRTFPHAVVVISIMLLASCGIESQESTFKYGLQSLDELAKRASGELKGAIAAEKARLEEGYAKFPAEEGPRGEGLGKLKMEFRAFIDETGKKLAALTAAENTTRDSASKAEFSSRLQKLAGNWQGNGMRLLIASDGTVQYERVSGGATKTISGGTVTRIGDDSFDVKVLLATTTFRLDSQPRREGAAWKMTVDGIELIRR